MTAPEDSPEIIMFLRHGEKPGESGAPHGVNKHGELDGHSLSVLGWTRAGALAGLFAHAPSAAHPYVVRPERILATRPTPEAKSKREVDTATPTAQRLGITLEDDHTHGNEIDLVEEVLGRSESTLIVWHHGTMAKIVRHFPVTNKEEIPHRWPDERFDLIWILVKEPSAVLAYRFISVPQLLLAHDLDER